MGYMNRVDLVEAAEISKNTTELNITKKLMNVTREL